MKYQIEIHYRTGNSFGSNDTTDYLDGTWENLEILKENIKRIKNHTEWYEKRSSTYSTSPKVSSKPSTTVDEFSLLLKLDNGTEYQIHAFWCGYFEHLYKASVVPVENELPSYKFEY